MLSTTARHPFTPANFRFAADALDKLAPGECHTDFLAHRHQAAARLRQLAETPTHPRGVALYNSLALSVYVPYQIPRAASAQ